MKNADEIIMKNILLLFLLPLSVFSQYTHTELGTPASSYDLSIVFRTEFASGVRCDLGVPIWVSYNLNKDWFGDVPRFTGNFIVDSLLPVDCRIRHSDYTNSGYDRGHMVRSLERTRTVDQNKATFRMSNIIPQLPELNQQTWLRMEEYIEKLALDSLKEMYIFAGPVYAKDKPYTFYNDKVAIPDSCYKIVVVLPYGSKKDAVNEHTEVIACMFPNNAPDVKNHHWTTYKTTIDHIEQSTGIDFLWEIPKSIQDVLEGRSSTSVPNNSQLLIYPNPATDYVVIPSENFTVYNSLGFVVGTYTYSKIDVSA
ncbi:MAG: DNA/RNA non-specific endonuclease, partial [Candidatus Kapabacteria bacterium]|nr:DNA/RNA non-specific endonuclease [Candidatus Kapabacteria bacterium]